MNREPTDARSVVTEPFSPTVHHELLAAMQGEWSGPTETWLNPPHPPEECTTHASARLVLGGRWLRIEYGGEVMGKKHGGEMLLGFHRDGARYQLCQIDSFHTGSEILMFEGKPREDGEICVSGTYAAGTERWGWRTTFRLESRDALLIRSWNITPDGQEFPAIEMRLGRLGE